jgi:hypothetical protein
MNEWIKTEEQLPNSGDLVICYNDHQNFDENGPFFICRYQVSYWDMVNDTHPNSSNYRDFSPTHWMPLPQKPTQIPSVKHVGSM